MYFITLIEIARQWTDTKMQVFKVVIVIFPGNRIEDTNRLVLIYKPALTSRHTRDVDIYCMPQETRKKMQSHGSN